jgi:hypothetical protein
MCVLCYELLPEGHWSDGVSADGEGGSPLRARYARARILSAVLAP